MEKKMYIAPNLQIVTVKGAQMICASITDVNGTAGIMKGGDGTGQNDAGARRYSIWDDEE
jgi:hypothetical protein